ncbi:4Fe-4S cluster-binding domain-containing protein, partial [Clostridium sp.]
NVHGVSILGGEPMQQLMDDSLLKLLTRIKEETNKEIWLWSGYTYDEIISNPRRKEILEQVDVLIDGPFKAEMKNLSLKYRGSENQRVIDVKKSLQENKVVLINAI